MSVTTELLVALAERLDSAGAGSWAGLSAPVGSGDVEPVITLYRTPSSPDRVIRLRAYYGSARDYSTDSVVAVQVFVRGTSNPETALAMTDSVVAALHGIRADVLGTGSGQVSMAQCLLNSQTDLGEDELGRASYALNFYVNINIPDDSGRTD